MNADGITEACDILELNHSGVYTPANRGPHMQISCPLAIDDERHDGDDHRPSCSITVSDDEPSKARCHGAKCGYRGTFLMMLEEAAVLRWSGEITDTVRALRKLLRWAREVETPSPSNSLASSQRTVDARPKTLNAAMSTRKDKVLDESAIRRLDNTYHPYAAKRGITEAAWKRWGIHFDARKQCLAFPVRSLGGALVGLTGRYVRDDVNPKSHNYPGLDKSLFLMGENLLEFEKAVVIVEGPIDCVVTDEPDEDFRVVSTLGEGFGEKHAKTLRRFHPSRVIIFTDGDSGGVLISKKIARLLAPHLPLYLVDTPKGKDPGSLSRDERLSLIADARRILTSKSI